MAKEQFVTFEDAMNRLGCTEEQLETLVANGDLRGIMMNREMHFKESDIAAMAEVNADAATISDSGAPSGGEELVLLDDVDAADELPPPEAEEEIELPMELPAEATAAFAPEAEEFIALEEEEIALLEEEEPAPESEDEPEVVEIEEVEDDAAPTMVLEEDEEPAAGRAAAASDQLGLGTEEIVFEDDDLAIGLDDSSGGTQAMTVHDDAIQISDDGEVATIEDDAVMATEIVDEGGDTYAIADERSSRRGAGVSRRRSQRVGAGPARGSALPEPKDSPVWAVVLALALVVSFLLPVSILYAVVQQGHTMRHDSFLPSEVGAGQVPELGQIFIPDHVKSIEEELKTFDYFGNKTVDEQKKPGEPGSAPLPATPAE